MLTLTHVLLFTNQIALALLLWRQWHLHRQAQATARALAALPASLQAPDLTQALGEGPREIIAIEILNPLELAARESRFAETFGSLTPALIRKIVYQRTLETLGPQLETFGVKADVRLHRAA